MITILLVGAALAQDPIEPAPDTPVHLDKGDLARATQDSWLVPTYMWDQGLAAATALPVCEERLQSATEGGEEALKFAYATLGRVEEDLADAKDDLHASSLALEDLQGVNDDLVRANALLTQEQVRLKGQRNTWIAATIAGSAALLVTSAVAIAATTGE